MLRRKDFVTIITPIPSFIPRQLAIDILHSHGEVITLNPLVLEYKAIKAPRDAASDEYYSTWYEIIERIQYIPGIGKFGSGKISFNGCFHNMPWGLQAHIYAPMNIDMRYKYQIGGNQPGIEPAQPLEMGLLALGAPSEGLYLREDVHVKANIAVIGFVKSQLKAASKAMVERIIKKAELVDAGALHAMMEDGKIKTFNPADRSHTLSVSPVPSPSPAIGTMAHDRNSKRISSQSSPPTQPGTPGSPPPVQYQVPRPQTTYSAYRPGSAGVAQLQHPSSPGPGQDPGLYGGGYPSPGYPAYPMQPQHTGYAGAPGSAMPGYYPQQMHPSMYGQYPPQQFQQPQMQYAELQAYAPADIQPAPQAPAPVEMVGDFYHAQAVPQKLSTGQRQSYQGQGHDAQMRDMEQRQQQQHLAPSTQTSASSTPQTKRDSDTLASTSQWSLPSQQQQHSAVAGSRPHSTASDSGSTSSGMAPVGGYRSPDLDKSFSSDLATHAETADEHHLEALKKLDPVTNANAQGR